MKAGAIKILSGKYSHYTNLKVYLFLYVIRVLNQLYMISEDIGPTIPISYLRINSMISKI